MFAKLCVVFLMLQVSGVVTSGQCHTRVDDFMRKIFKGWKVSLTSEELIALTDIKRGTFYFHSNNYKSSLTVHLAVCLAGFFF